MIMCRDRLNSVCSAGADGKVSVRLFLNDGYEAPPEEEDLFIDMHSEEYCGMISRSLLQLGNPYRIRKAIEKSKAGKEVTLAYIGGSITQGAGAIPIHTECYAYKSFQLFQNRFRHRTMSGLSKPESAEHLQNWE